MGVGQLFRLLAKGHPAPLSCSPLPYQPAPRRRQNDVLKCRAYIESVKRDPRRGVIARRSRKTCRNAANPFSVKHLKPSSPNDDDGSAVSPDFLEVIRDRNRQLAVS